MARTKKDLPYGIAGIYLITCVANGSKYVGQAYDLGIRWDSHISALRGGRHCNQHLQNIYEKYGENSLDFDVLKTIKTEIRERFDSTELKLLLTSMEQIYLSTLIIPDVNILKWASSPLGLTRPDNFSENCSIARCTKDYVGISPNNEIFYFRQHTKFAKDHGLNPDLIRACGQGSMIHTRKWVFVYKEHAENIDDLIKYRKDRLEGYAEEKRLRARTCKKTRNYIGLSPNGIVHEFEFPSIFAEKHNLWSGLIQECCRGTAGLHKGWIFDYRENFTGSIEEYKQFAENKKSQILLRYKENMRKHSYVGINPIGNVYFFDFAKDFAEEHDICWTAIHKCCSGELKTHSGWVFMHEKDYDESFDFQEYMNKVKIENKINRIKRANGTKTKYYKGVSKEGAVVYFDNCRDFCRNNDFACPNMIGRVCSGDRPHYKGWKFEQITKEEYLRLTNDAGGRQGSAIA